ALDNSFSNAESGDFRDWDSFQPLFLFSFFYGNNEEYYYVYFFNCGANAYHKDEDQKWFFERYYGVKYHYTMLFASEYLKGSSDQTKLMVLKKMRDYYVSVYLLDGNNLITEYDEGGIDEDFFCRIIADIKHDNPSLFEKVAAAMLTTYENEDLVNMLNKAFLTSTNIKRETHDTTDSFHINQRSNSQPNSTYTDDTNHTSNNSKISNNYSNRTSNNTSRSSEYKKNSLKTDTKSKRSNSVYKKRATDYIGLGFSILSRCQRSISNKRKKN
ncbi:MAG: hypothetical protein K2G29_07025, partial [Muribaculaceae bacterium]|nr:hypothetical protein [Muribaculaceae bacterium]